MNRPAVSILTPTFNHRRFIGACIESVLAQTLADWEMIVVDDGSTDGAWDLIQDYARRDPRVRPFRQENQGIWRLGETYNFALDQARGDLIAILEGDDFWPPDRLERQVPAHRARGVDLTFGCIYYVDADGNRTSEDPYLRGSFVERIERDYCTPLLRGEFFIPPVSVLIDRAALERTGGFHQPPYLPAVDYSTFVPLACQGSVHFLPEPLGNWRLSSGQVTWQLSREIARGSYRFAREYTDAHRATLPPDLAARGLLSDSRRHQLADSSLRASLVAYDRGDAHAAVRHAVEILRLRERRLFVRCAGILVWKTGRRIKNRVVGRLPGRTS